MVSSYKDFFVNAEACHCLNNEYVITLKWALEAFSYLDTESKPKDEILYSFYYQKML